MENIYCLILNTDEIVRLEEENEQFPDKEEGEIRNRLLDEISEKVWHYQIHIREYNCKKFMKALVERGVTFSPVKRKAIVSQWDSTFDALVSKQKKRATKLYSDQFRWHLFSFKLLDAKTDADAKTLFDLQPRDTLYCFHDYSDETWEIKNAHLLTAQDLDIYTNYCDLNKSDIYLFEPTKKWTYIKTHEEDCGPYFFSAKEK